MSRAVRLRLSIMMFLEYVVPGATTPILSHYLKNYLHFPPYQVGYILAVIAVAAFIAPFVASHIADRWIRSERLLALCHLASAACMLLLAQQTQFRPFLILYFFYGLAFTPTFGLTNTLALAVVPNARRDFGGIRMWGTAGWVAIAWVFSLLWLRGGVTPEARLPHALYVSAIASVVLAVYSLTLPSSAGGVSKRPDKLMYWKALKLMTRPGFAFLCVMTFMAAMTHQVYYYGMSPFLSQAGLANHLIMPAMSIGQLSEVVMLGILGMCLARISIKQALIVGLAAQALRYFLFASGTSSLLIMSGISLHGLCYAFYFTSAYIYIDQHSTRETRAAAQQIFTIVISGLGTFGAYVAGGYLGQALSTPGTGAISFQPFWVVPGIISAMLAVALALFFKEEAPVEVSDPGPVEA